MLENHPQVFEFYCQNYTCRMSNFWRKYSNIFLKEEITKYHGVANFGHTYVKKAVTVASNLFGM